MASGSGKDRDDGKQEPARVHGQREDANAASPTGAQSFGVGAAQAGSDSSAPPPRSTPPADGQAGGGSRKAGGSSSAAREGVSGVSLPPAPSTPPVDAQARGRIFEAGGSSSAAAHAGEQAGLPKAKKTFLSKIISFSKNKLFCRKGTGSSERPHVNRQAISFEGALDYYAEQIRAIHLHERVDPVNALDLRGLYSDFRPVKVDGECFYRSFIFSYLEQVVDRQDTNEEERLLAAIEEVAEEEHARLGWASEFSSSHEAFKELIKKVKSWKKKRRLIPVLTDRYLKRKLLKFFSTYDRTEDIFVFLRLVAAIWLCSHRADYEEVIPGLGENDIVADWCLQHVTPRRMVAARAQMWALAAALKVSLVFARLSVGKPEDVYVSSGADALRVDVLFTVDHYDILYPTKSSIARLILSLGDCL